ncbi:MAG TPA: AI-2E family transporter YdiK [Povalibacter sp.]|uniref:AI-2E family transporter YdiK n=1 Tax=Povalibacter sp. TaxID=1962978 RepID=UPI002CF3F654|nr:AI-2E family transporter YdiK [Povalibacter sp.]HMN45504.1 AI-2E family transporter YdiK [Povalibacter sp.]
MNTNASHDITRIFLTILVIAALIVGSLWTLLPFVGALIWATTLVVATWPLLSWLQRRFRDSRTLAVIVLTVAVLLIFITPILLTASALIDAAHRAPAVVRDFVAEGISPPPAWVAGIPVVGARIAERWQAVSAVGPDALIEMLQPFLRSASAWILSITGDLGALLLHILLTVVLVAILYAQGETAARGVLAFARRLGGTRGEETAQLAGKSVRSVALGVVVTALVQSLLAGLGLWVCGVPHAAVLTAVIFVCGVAQLGPLPVLLLAIGWLYWSGSSGWGTALLIWSIPVVALDNILRPMLIRRGVELPMLLIIAGVIGGLIAFGVLGLFIGPVILAATYTLLQAWIAEYTTQATGAS